MRGEADLLGGVDRRVVGAGAAMVGMTPSSHRVRSPGVRPALRTAIAQDGTRVPNWSDWYVSDARLRPRRPVPAHRRPAAGHRAAERRPRAGPPPPDPPRRDRHRQDGDDGLDHRRSTRSRRSCSPTTRRWPPSCTPSSASSSPNNAVEYFVSYFDYYQPEAYLPRTDTYIEKDSSPQRRDRPAAPRRDARAVRAPRRDHRRVRVVHLRPGRAGRLRRDRPQAAGRRQVPARRRAPPPRRPPVPAQRPGADACAVPGPRRHAGAPAGLRGVHRPGRVLRRRGRADHRARPADRRAAGRAQGDRTSTRRPTS